MEDEEESLDDCIDDEAIKNHHTYDQVMLDVNRCAGRLQHVMQNDDNDYDDQGNVIPNELQIRLSRLIVRLLMHKPNLHYYQGFHDICLTSLLIMGEEKSFKCLNKLIDTHLFMYMQPSIKDTEHMLELIPVIIGQEDERLAQFLKEAQVGTIYALSWAITWFSHVIPYQEDIEKLFRLFSERDPKLVLYLCACIVLYKRQELMKLDCEMSTVHHYLSLVPRKERLPLDSLLGQAEQLFDRLPPDELEHLLRRQRAHEKRLRRLALFKTKMSKIGEPITDLVRSSPKTAIIVIVLISALAVQYDGWRRWMSP